MYVIGFFVKYMKCWEESLSMLRSPSVLAPFIVFAALQFLALVCLALFSVSPLSSVMVPLVQRIGGEQALHYPMHLVLLPRLYYMLYLPLTAVVGFVLFGWAVSLVVEQYERNDVEIAGRRRCSTAALIPSMIVAGLIFVAVITAVQLGVSYFSEAVANVWGRRLLSMGSLVALILVQVFLVYSLYFLVTRTSNPFLAVLESVRLGRRKLALTAALVLTVFLIHLPVDFLTQRSDKVVLKFDPGLVVILLAAGIVVEIITNYFLFASTTSVAVGEGKEETR
jgi:hypothetical protein